MLAEEIKVGKKAIVSSKCDLWLHSIQSIKFPLFKRIYCVTYEFILIIHHVACWIVAVMSAIYCFTVSYREILHLFRCFSLFLFLFYSHFFCWFVSPVCIHTNTNTKINKHRKSERVHITLWNVKLWSLPDSC